MLLANLSRLQAFGIHLVISLLILFVLLYLLVFHWYPDFYFHSDGGWQGIRIIVSVDLVLGPLLTLIVFKPGKKGLKFDLGLIGLIQVGSLAAGVWIVYDQRPAALVFADKQFFTVSYGSLRLWDIDPSSLDHLPRESGSIVKAYTVLPEDKGQLSKLRFAGLQGKLPMHMRTDLYEPYAEHAVKVIPLGRTTTWMKTEYADQTKHLNDWLANRQLTDEDARYLPLTTRDADGYLVIDSQSGEVHGYIAM